MTDQAHGAPTGASSPSSQPEAEPMPLHPHLPKPPHNWRVALGEVAIITVGIFIALSLEEVMHTVHSRSEAVEADEFVRGEIGSNIGRLRLRMQTRSCIDRRISELQAILDGAAAQPNIVTPSWVGRPIYSTFLRNRWETESQAGHAAIIKSNRLSGYAVMYAQMRDVENEMMVEQADWAKLRTLEHLRRLDQPALFELNATLQDARYRTWRIAVLTSRLIDLAKGLELEETPSGYPASRAVCLPITTTRAAADRMSVFRFGEP